MQHQTPEHRQNGNDPFASAIHYNPLFFTDAGAGKARELLTNSGKNNAAIRVFVKSGGCSGYTYGMAIDDRELEGDQRFQSQGIDILVDPRSLPLISGSEIDYVENIMGGGFDVRNPQATSACGCGHSFRTDGSDAPAGEGSSACH